ncbi:phosphorylcholine transferase LicD [Ruminococcus flavefaciens]|uniref:LicD family protein n=1 Tax=Ruminococcus flavefaciens TaxID=1265 RepID=UPI0026EEB50D|nr:LicD family protein [Ruminococcus flavefaciens]
MKDNAFMNCDVEDLHKAQLDILREVKRVCNKNNLRYYLCFGTCLGAVRHKGFIPWDSDIDIVMYASDADKLLTLQNEFKDEYFIQSNDTDPGFGANCIRIRKSDTTFIERELRDQDINHGVWIDVYPLYYCPKSDMKKRFYIILSFFNRLLIANRVPQNHGKAVKIVSNTILTIIPNGLKKKISRGINNKLKSYKDTEEVFHYLNGKLKLRNPDISKAAWFQEPKDMEFEGELFSGPTCPHEFLTMTYGNYMKLPPKEEQVVKFDGAFIDTNNSYKKYKGIKYCKKRNRVNK